MDFDTLLLRNSCELLPQEKVKQNTGCLYVRVEYFFNFFEMVIVIVRKIWMCT